MKPLGNAAIADRLGEIAGLLEVQGASGFRVEAYRRAAGFVRRLDRPAASLLHEGGVPALVALPTIGYAIARVIGDLVETGRCGILDRLRGESDAVAVLASVPAIGPVLAERLHRDLHIETLEDLELAAHDGRLERVQRFGTKRLAAVRETLATRLGRHRGRAPVTLGTVESLPPVEELLSVDHEYRERAAAGDLKRIAPRRFNPTGEAWLSVLHTTRGERHYTALSSNTARAHQLHTTRDWVVIYADGRDGEHQWTVITARRGPFRGRRIVRGREAQCYALFRERGARRGLALVPPGGDSEDPWIA